MCRLVGVGWAGEWEGEVVEDAALPDHPPLSIASIGFTLPAVVEAL